MRGISNCGPAMGLSTKIKKETKGEDRNGVGVCSSQRSEMKNAEIEAVSSGSEGFRTHEIGEMVFWERTVTKAEGVASTVSLLDVAGKEALSGFPGGAGPKGGGSGPRILKTKGQLAKCQS